MIDDFVYEGNSNFPYPTCSFNKGIKTSKIDDILLADFTFLASVSYYNHTVTQDSLNKWFGEDEGVIDRVDMVKDFQSAYMKNEEKSAVSYKLISLPLFLKYHILYRLNYSNGKQQVQIHSSHSHLFSASSFVTYPYLNTAVLYY